jgi:hypothetical protein
VGTGLIVGASAEPSRMDRKATSSIRQLTRTERMLSPTGDKRQGFVGNLIVRRATGAIKSSISTLFCRSGTVRHTGARGIKGRYY